MAWSEAEAKAAVAGYFQLLEAEREGRPTNKAALYRRLSANFPQRNPRAFELKFQNISAIMYEQSLPYCKGLKPRSNYQRLLKLLVLDHLDRSPLPAVEPHEILFEKIRELRSSGPISVPAKGAGRFGLAIENALGIPPNSAKAPDFMGIELKAKRDQSLQTLFSRVPSRFVEDDDKRAFFERHCYQDSKRGRRALYTSFCSVPDSLGFSLRVEDQIIQTCREGRVVLEYDAEELESALLSKHTQTAFLRLSSSRREGKEQCTIESATYCKWPSIIRFLRLVQRGDVYLDFTMSERVPVRIIDHGFLWRIKTDALDELYLSSSVLDLDR